MKDILIEVTQQGDAVVGKVGYMAQISDTMATFYLDGWGKTGRIYPLMTADSVYDTETKTIRNVPSMTVEDGDDDSSCTEICFPEFEGWHVFAAFGGKTMSICLRKIL